MLAYFLYLHYIRTISNWPRSIFEAAFVETFEGSPRLKFMTVPRLGNFNQAATTPGSNPEQPRRGPNRIDHVSAFSPRRRHVTRAAATWSPWYTRPVCLVLLSRMYLFTYEIANIRALLRSISMCPRPVAICSSHNQHRRRCRPPTVSRRCRRGPSASKTSCSTSRPSTSSSLKTWSWPGGRNARGSSTTPRRRRFSEERQPVGVSTSEHFFLNFVRVNHEGGHVKIGTIV